LDGRQEERGGRRGGGYIEIEEGRMGGAAEAHGDMQRQELEVNRKSGLGKKVFRK